MKRAITFILALCLLILPCTFVHAEEPISYPDMPDDWSTKALQSAVERGLLTGSYGMILPKNNLTVAQMSAIIARAFAAEEKADLTEFTDVDKNAWYYEYMQKAVAMKVFTGDGAGHLNPDKFITRQQVFAVLTRAFQIEEKNRMVIAKFSDNGDIAEWAKGAAAALIERKYVNGSQGKINPKNNITRAEFAQIMYNIASDYIDKPGTVNGKYSANIIIRSSDVIIDGAEIEGNIIICEGCSNIVIKNTKLSGIIVNYSGNKIETDIEVPDDKKDDDKKTDSGNENKKDDSDNKKTDDTFLTVDPSDRKDDKKDDGKDDGKKDDTDYDDDNWTDIYR